MSGDDELVLPDLHEALLDDATLSQLFFDLEAAAQVIDVRLKTRPGAHADGETVSLESARHALASGAAIGAQIRYLHGNTEWWDTLMRTAEGVRLIRIQPPRAD